MNKKKEAFQYHPQVIEVKRKDKIKILKKKTKIIIKSRKQN